MTKRARLGAALPLLQTAALFLLGWADLQGGMLTVALRESIRPGGTAVASPGESAVWGVLLVALPALLLSVTFLLRPPHRGQSAFPLCQGTVLVALLGFVFRWSPLISSLMLREEHSLGGWMLLNEGLAALVRLGVLVCAALALWRGRRKDDAWE